MVTTYPRHRWKAPVGSKVSLQLTIGTQSKTVLFWGRERMRVKNKAEEL